MRGSPETEKCRLPCPWSVQPKMLGCVIAHGNNKHRYKPRKTTSVHNVTHIKKKSFISLLFLSSFGKTLSKCQKLFLARQLVLIEPYGVYWRDWRERGRHFHLKAAACMVMKWESRGGKAAVQSYEQRVFRQQPDNAWAIRLKGFGIRAAFSPSTYMKGTNVNTYKGNAYSWT